MHLASDLYSLGGQCLERQSVAGPSAVTAVLYCFCLRFQASYQTQPSCHTATAVNITDDAAGPFAGRSAALCLCLD